MINYFDNENSLADCLNYVESFELFIDGKNEIILKENLKFNAIISKLEKLFCSSRLMPAFGVSMHRETQNALKADKWIKINFNKILTKNGLNFSALIFKLEETNGFNLIREYDNKFVGRCLYLDLDELTNLEELIFN